MPRTHPECLRSVQRANRWLEEKERHKKHQRTDVDTRDEQTMKNEPAAKPTRKRGVVHKV